MDYSPKYTIEKTWDLLYHFEPGNYDGMYEYIKKSGYNFNKLDVNNNNNVEYLKIVNSLKQLYIIVNADNNKEIIKLDKNELGISVDINLDKGSGMYMFRKNIYKYIPLECEN